MTVRINLLVGVLLAVNVPAFARQQAAPSGRAQGGPQPDPQVGQCAQAQPAVSANIEGALKRLDEARQTNSAATLRAAADDLQAALLDVRARLAPCAAMQVAGSDAHAGHAMPNTTVPPPAAPGTPAMAPGAPRPAPGAAAPGAPAPTGADPHAGHAAPGAASQPSAPRPSRSGGGAPARLATQPAPVAGPGAATGVQGGHMMTAAADSELVKDPRCAENVTAQNSPQAEWQGRTYYFCTESHRQRFVADPALYLASPSGKAADPHAGHGAPQGAGRAPQRTTGAQPRPAAPAAADPHAGHAMQSAPSSSSRPSSGSPPATDPDRPPSDAEVPPAATAARSRATGSAAAPPTSLDALKCEDAVDRRTAPRMLYQGRMYYFCSEQERAAFAKDPGKFVSATQAPAPAAPHAH